MPKHRRQYPAWKAPSEDGATLIWPAPAELLQQTRENHQHLSSSQSTRAQNTPLPDVRRAMREFIGNTDDRPMLAMGHQTELIHPGVWVKNCLIDAAAKKLDGLAYHLAVDTDAPKHLHLKFDNETLPITDDPSITTASWCGQLEAPTPAHLDSIHQKLSPSPGTPGEGRGEGPVLPDVLNSLKKLAIEPHLPLSSALANALHELDWHLGLRHHVLLTSPIWTCPAYQLFVHDLLARADRLASDYNAALNDYRAAHGMQSNTRPMPDLVVSPGAIEIPFWLDDLNTGQRTRPSVFRDDAGWILKLISGEEFIFDAKMEGWEAAVRLQRWLVSTNHRLSPRALMLTMFFRMFLVDQFVHGIGGGQYDQVTDELIARYYGIEPPSFAVSTATMYLPQAAGRERLCVPCVKQEGHRLKHGLLGQRKMELVGQIESLPRRSPQRLERFMEMHKQLSTVAAETGALVRWSDRVREIREQEKQEQSLFDREQFYGMQTRERLETMIEKYKSQI